MVLLLLLLDVALFSLLFTIGFLVSGLLPQSFRFHQSAKLYLPLLQPATDYALHHVGLRQAFASMRWASMSRPMTNPIQPIPKNPVPGILFTSGLPPMAMKYTLSTLTKLLSVVTSLRNQSPPQ